MAESAAQVSVKLTARLEFEFRPLARGQCGGVNPLGQPFLVDLSAVTLVLVVGDITALSGESFTAIVILHYHPSLKWNASSVSRLSNSQLTVDPKPVTVPVRRQSSALSETG